MLILHASVAPIVTLADQACFERALTLLGRCDAAFLPRVLGNRSIPALRRRDPGFEGLAWIVIGQQVSTSSASAIFTRLKSGLGTLDATHVLAASDADLRACGLSGPKQRTLRAIAAAVVSGGLDLSALVLLSAEAAHQALCAIKGIGPWTADIFLLFCLGHADAWPSGDLALQEAARLALELPQRPDAKALIAIGEAWRPYRGVAAHCLWDYYGAQKQAERPVPAAPSPRKRKA